MEIFRDESLYGYSMRPFLAFAFLVCMASWGRVEPLEQVVESKTVALITGCSRGIGLATAELLAKNGYVVYATGRNLNSASNGPNFHFRRLDVTDSCSIHLVVDEIIKREGRLDVLINNAGYALGGPVESLLMTEVQEQMDVNFFGIIRTCQEVLPHMRRRKSGRIINISSEQGVYGLPYGSLYTASKSALESLSEALSIEVSPWNIFVSIVEPGFVATNFSVRLGSRYVENSPYQRIMDILGTSLKEKRVCSNTCQSPEEVAGVLQRVLEDPAPRLRYQTSKMSEELVSEYITDITGMEYSKRMKALMLEVYQGAWSAD